MDMEKVSYHLGILLFYNQEFSILHYICGETHDEEYRVNKKLISVG